MTSKKRRQRGSRTHGGGTQKNRRGAGNRGGRGAAGRDKHEFHNHEPLGKSGFKRPAAVTESVVEVTLREIDEDVLLFAERGLAEETDDGYRIDAREVVEDGFDSDVVKVLGGGQIRNRLEIVADDFSEGARERIESAGGQAIVSERATDEESEE